MPTDAPTPTTLYRLLEPTVGPEAAQAVSDALPPVPWSELATKADLRELQAANHADLAELRSDLTSEISTLRTDLTTETSTLRSDSQRNLTTEIATLRTDLTTEIRALRDDSQRNLTTEISTLRTDLTTEIRTLRDDCQRNQAEIRVLAHEVGELRGLMVQYQKDLPELINAAVVRALRSLAGAAIAFVTALAAVVGVLVSVLVYALH